MAEQEVLNLIIDARAAIAEARKFADAMGALADKAAVAAAQNDQLEEAMGAAGVTMVRQEQTASRLARSVERLRAQADPLYATQQKLAKAAADLDAAYRRGIITQEQQASIFGALQQRLGLVTPALAATGNAARLSAFQMQQLSFQANDVITQLASGTPVFQVFAQQGGQIYQVFGGLRPMLAAVGALFTPITVGIAAVTAVLGGGLLAWRSYSNSMREVETAARAQGNALGLTRDGLQDLARQMAEAGDVSVRTAREMEATFLRTGKLSADMMVDLTGIVRDYAAMTGQEAAQAAADLASKFSDVEKGAKELDAAYNILSAAQVRDIQNALEQGRQGEAQKILFDALNERAKGFADDGLTWLGRAWNSVAAAASNAFDWMGRALQRAPMAEQAARLRQQLAEAQAEPEPTGPAAGLGAAYRSLTGTQTAREARIQQLQREISALEEAMRLQDEVAGSQQTAAEMRRYEKQIAERTAAIEKLNAEQARSLELARMEGDERARAQARDRARAELLQKVPDATAAEIKAAEDRAEAVVRAEQATAAAVKARSEAQRDAAANVRKFQAEEEKAREADRKRILGEIEAIDRYKASVKDQIAGIRAETAMLGMNAEERAVTVELMKAEEAARKANTQLTEEERKAIEDETRARERRREKIEEGEKARRDAERVREQQAREAEKMTDDIVQYAGDTFADLFADTEGGWKRMWSNMLDWARRTIARIAAEMILRPVITPVVGSMMAMPGAARAGGLGSAGSSGLGIGDLSGIGQMLSGGSGIMGGINSFGTSLGFASGLPMAAPSASFIGPMPLAQGGLFGTTTFGQFLGGAGLGFGAGTLLGSIFGMSGTGNTIGSGAGSLAGALIGSLPAIGMPIIGGLLGGALGGLLGGLFKKKPKDAEWNVLTLPAPRPGLHSVQSPFGWLGEDSFKTRAWDELTVLKAIGEIDRQAAALLSEADVARGAAALQARQPPRQKERELDEGDVADNLRARYAILLQGLGAGARPLERMSSADRTLEGTAQRLTEILAERQAVRDMIEQTGEMGQISKSVGEQVKALSEQLTKVSTATEDWGFEAEKVQAATRRMVEEFLGMREAEEPMSDTAKALAALNERFRQGASLARQYGISEAELAAARQNALDKLTEGFDEGVRRQILGIENPLELALEDWEKAAEQRLADARLIGGNIVEVERLNALERARIIEQFANQGTAGLRNGLRGLLTELTASSRSPLAPETALANAETRFMALRSQALAGDATALAQIEEAARSFLDLSRQNFASTPEFFSRFDTVVDTLRQLTVANDNQAMLTAMQTTAARMGEANEELRSLREEVAALRAQVAAQNVELRRLAAA